MTDNPLAAAFAAWQRPEDEPYFAALGRLVSAYAYGEANVHVLARQLSKLDDAKARGIFGGMRFSDLTDRVHHMMAVDNTPKEIAEEIKSCLQQLNVIGEYRDHIAHRLAYYKDGLLFITNALTAKSKIEVKAFSLSELQEMRMDCLAVALRLSAVAFPEIERDDEVSAAARRPWLYKPSKQGGRKKQPIKA
jgi:hypothetical protein